MSAGVNLRCADGKVMPVEMHLANHSAYINQRIMKDGESELIDVDITSPILKLILYWYRIFLNNPQERVEGKLLEEDARFFQTHYFYLLELMSSSNRLLFARFSQASQNFIAFLIRGRTNTEIRSLLNFNGQ